MEQEILRLQSAIEGWARKNDVWFDAGFSTYANHVDAEPVPPAVITVMWYEGDLNRVIDGDIEHLHIEFYDLIDKLGYELGP